MNSEEEFIVQEIENDKNKGKNKIRLLVVSSWDNQSKIDIDSNSLMDLTIKDLMQTDNDIVDNQHLTTIVNINEESKNLSISEINNLAISSLGTKHRGSSKWLSMLDQSDISNSIEEGNKYESDDDHLGLKSRSKYQKLTVDQIKFIKNVLIESKLTFKQIQFEYNLSYSVINKIKRSTWRSINSYKRRNLLKFYGTQKDRLLKAINEYVSKWKHILIAIEVADHVYGTLNQSYSVMAIRSIMKDKLKLSFKRVKSRSNSINFHKINSVRRLFSIKFSKFIDANTLVINIDEASINRNTKQNYFWGWEESQTKFEILYLLDQ